MAAAIAGSALIATYPTARFATGLDPHVLRLSFAVFLATTAGTVAYRTWRGGARVEKGRRRAWGWVTVVGLVGGVVSGFFGVGGAFIAPPLLTAFFGLRQLEAQGLALALVSPSALLALVAYAGAGQVDWIVGVPLALGGIAAISAGVAFASLPARETDAVGLLWTLAAYRDPAGAAGVIEAVDQLAMTTALPPRSPAKTRKSNVARVTKVREATDEFPRVDQGPPRRSRPCCAARKRTR
jgi:uncharacterized membrane protein YagU involved in acid resistance